MFRFTHHDQELPRSHHPARGTTSTMCIVDGVVAFTAYEDNNVDFNGDGDGYDLVIHV